MAALICRHSDVHAERLVTGFRDSDPLLRLVHELSEFAEYSTVRLLIATRDQIKHAGGPQVEMPLRNTLVAPQKAG